MKTRNKKSVFCESIFNELYEIKCHLANDRPFEGGVGIGGLMNFLLTQVEQALEEEDENEEIQDEESDKECEEGSEEEDEESSEDSYYSDYLNEKRMREASEKNMEELLKKHEEDDSSLKSTRTAIFELQDLLMRLIKFSKIDKIEIPHVLNILRNTGVQNSDIKVICNLKTEDKECLPY